MVANGELAAAGDGYRLVGPALLARQSRQIHSRVAETERWEGRWTIHVVTSGEARSAAERSELRSALARLRFAELREGTWLRPTNLPADRDPAAARTVAGQCVAFHAEPDDGAALVKRLWDLATWSALANELSDEVGRLGGPLARHDPSALAECFVVSADVLRHLQADPLLPEALLPASWPGTRLRQHYDRFDADFRATLTGWLRSHLAP